jgi:hypothetical protein
MFFGIQRSGEPNTIGGPEITTQKGVVSSSPLAYAPALNCCDGRGVRQRVVSKLTSLAEEALGSKWFLV